MTRGRPEFDSSPRDSGIRLSTVGRLATRAGVVIVVIAVPLAVATFLALVRDASTLSEGFDAAIAASSGPLAVGGGVPWLFHVGVFGILVGCWFLGAGLVLSGLTD